MIDKDLLQKYNVPVPRYTSYPTVPYWKDAIDSDQWKANFSKQFNLHNHKDGISLYIHLPFCESLCTYCGCNKKITTNHAVEDEYIPAILKEWDMYLALMGEAPLIRELHIGGGTPTFFSPQNLEKLVGSILAKAIISEQHDFSIEGHPNNTTNEHLQVLYKLGFRRVSYGVQDNDAEVQRIINRIQPFENVKRATETARETGFSSVNFDLIYGLPRQTVQSIRNTINQSISLKPDRVAFYSYAHVPWTSRGQRLFDELDLPDPETKMQLYITGKDLFLQNGYFDIGMDHFALKTDDLYKAHLDGSLHRNFMGYTTQRSALLLGLGVSSISDTGNAYGQNRKTLHDYYEQINKGELTIQKGYFLNSEDVIFKRYILDIACRNNAYIHDIESNSIKKYTLPVLKTLQDDGLVQLHNSEVKVTTLGRHFIRNICSAFDLHLQKNLSNKAPLFSKAI
jgi:oxygen-independent coproporphyrinogen-3 oxidase